MKTKKVNNRLLLGILLFGISVLLWNCEKEETFLELQNEQQKVLFVPKAMNLKEAMRTVNFNKLSAGFKLTPFLDNQSLKSASDFNLDLDNFYEISYDDYISYTFLITRDTSTEEIVENLVIEQKNDSIRGYIIKYEHIDYYAQSTNVFLRAKISKTNYQGDINALMDDNNIHFQSKTTSGWECSYETTATPRYCSEHKYFNKGNMECDNKYLDNWVYTNVEVCNYVGGDGSSPDTFLDEGDPNDGAGGITDGATAPIIPCRESEDLGDMGLVGSNSDCDQQTCPTGQVADANGNCVNKPCAGDPIPSPELASSGLSGKKGGRFGCTRVDPSSTCGGISGKKRHDGTDIKAILNSDTFAIYDGTITSIRNSFSPGQYRKGSFGNFIVITTVINGTTYHIKYNHMNNVFVQQGQQIKVGDIIGLSGNTGNAAKKGIVPHVHIQIYNSNWTQKLDPEDFITTKFDSNNNPINPNC